TTTAARCPRGQHPLRGVRLRHVARSGLTTRRVRRDATVTWRPGGRRFTPSTKGYFSAGVRTGSKGSVDGDGGRAVGGPAGAGRGAAPLRRRGRQSQPGHRRRATASEDRVGAGAA